MFQAADECDQLEDPEGLQVGLVESPEGACVGEFVQFLKPLEYGND